METALAGFNEKCEVLGVEIKVAVEERVKQMAKPQGNLLTHLSEGLGQSKIFSAGMLLWGIYLAYRGYKTGAALAFVGLAAWVGYILGVGLPLAYYNNLIKAADWHRWTEVLKLVESSKRHWM